MSNLVDLKKKEINQYSLKLPKNLAPFQLVGEMVRETFHQLPTNQLQKQTKNVATIRKPLMFEIYL